MIRPLRYLGDPILRKKCKIVPAVTPEILSICKDLVDSMRPHNGTGLAAPQIGYDWRIFCVDTGEALDDEGYPVVEPTKVFINPEITYASTSTSRRGESCLSLPGFYEEVERSKIIDIKAIGIDGKEFEEKGVKLWRAQAIQHEMDHLDGILFIDRISDKAKKRIEKELKLFEMRHSQASLMRGDPFSL